MKCMICNAEFPKACSLGTHLRKTHGLGPQEYYDAYLKRDGDGICAECGKPTRFRSIGQGYVEFCSRGCAARKIASDTERNAHKVDAMRGTMTERYGADNAARVDKSVSKRKATMLDKYGVEYYSQHEGFAAKYHDTMIAEHGVGSAFAMPKVQAAIVETNMARRGVPYNFCMNVEDAKASYGEILGRHGCELLSFDNKKSITFRCGRCGSECTEQDLFIKLRDRVGSTPCTCCVPKDIHPSIGEKMLAEYVESLGFKVTHYDRDFIGQYGADIVVEDRKLIIEYDGLHWHTEEYHPNDYHLMKTEIAERAGYRLIHVFSDEWEYQRDIVKSRLAHILGVGNSAAVYARKCTVSDVPYSDAEAFLELNHIQGPCPSTERIGLYDDAGLVALMTFGKSRFEAGAMELLRYCTRTGVSVVGGAGRLLAEYRRRANGRVRLVSYADRRYSGADAFYGKLGFTLDGVTKPNYYYVVGSVRKSRMSFQRHMIADADDTRTEHEIMLDRGIYRIYDCGNYRYVLDIS